MKNRGSRGFTLAELIMAIALLSLFSVFIVQLFYKADTLARKARNLDQAVAVASNLADQWRMDIDDNIAASLLELKHNPAVGKTATIDLDSHFQPCTPDQVVFQAVLTVQNENTSMKSISGAAPIAGLWYLNIVIIKAEPTDSPPIYVLTVSRYMAGEVS